MTEHKCMDGKWADGYINDCPQCRPPGGSNAPVYLKEGYKTSTRTIRKKGGKEVQHWSGRQDAQIRPRPISSRATPNPR